MSHKRSVMEHKRLEKLYEETTKSGTKKIRRAGVWFDRKKNRYVRFSISDKSDLPKYFKKVSNKKVRRCEHTLNRGQYKKLFEYNWSLI